jgi:hypothetical protein
MLESNTFTYLLHGCSAKAKHKVKIERMADQSENSSKW